MDWPGSDTPKKDAGRRGSAREKDENKKYISEKMQGHRGALWANQDQAVRVAVEIEEEEKIEMTVNNDWIAMGLKTGNCDMKMKKKKFRSRGAWTLAPWQMR